jgi:hypothetical protein
VTCGFVEIQNCPLISKLKAKLILVAVAAQSFEEFQEYKRQHAAGKLSKDDSQQWKQTERNLNYLVDLIEPMVLKLQIFESVEKPLSSKTVMKAYRTTAAHLKILENYIVPTYNSELKLSKHGVQWNTVECRWEKVDDDDENED